MRRMSMVLVSCVVVLLVVVVSLGSGPAQVYASDVPIDAVDGQAEPLYLPYTSVEMAILAARVATHVAGQWLSDKLFGSRIESVVVASVPAAALD